MKVGIIGLGNMGLALLKGAASSYKFIVYDKNAPKRAAAETLGAKATDNELSIASECDMLIIAIKPKGVAALLERIKPVLNKECIVVSLAAGIGISELQSVLGEGANIALAMPNTPASIGRGVSALCFCDGLSQKAQDEVVEFFNKFGTAEVIDEASMPAFIGIAGSLPAYVCLFVEALSDAAVLAGMSRQKATQIAANAVSGSAEMIAKRLKDGMHPAQLKDAVASPSGTTIAAIRELERAGFRSAVIEAVLAAAKKGGLK